MPVMLVAGPYDQRFGERASFIEGQRRFAVNEFQGIEGVGITRHHTERIEDDDPVFENPPPMLGRDSKILTLKIVCCDPSHGGT